MPYNVESSSIYPVDDVARDRAARIRKLRIALDWSQSQLADAIPSPTVTKDYIHRWEYGTRPLDHHLRMLAEALGVSTADLYSLPLEEDDWRPPWDEP